MIPAYNNGQYLRRTLESVLCQDLGPDEMQIEVVDGGSTKDNPAEIVRDLGSDRVSVYRLPANRGLAHTFNNCIDRARGHWVHILHGDDTVLPGFYQAYAAVIEAHAQARMVVGQAVFIDEADRWTGIFGPTPPIDGGILADFVKNLAIQQLVVFPSVVVRREAYADVGGFCDLFNHVVDWDMWFRVGQLGPVACVPHPYARYRLHGESETSRLMKSASNTQEVFFIVQANLARLSASCQALGDYASWRSRLAAAAESTAWRLDSKNCTEGRYQQARWAWMLDPSIRRLVMLLKSWLKFKLNGKAAAHSSA
jgi:GT2 family glycosyltransferase